jgi:methylenetetrahydrofolate--tRNA-(uracil-5-)-methyltransferase
MTGVEGYIESAGSGFVAGLNAARLAKGLDQYVFPPVTMIGAMAAYVKCGSLSGKFTPMNANFGIIEPLDYRVKGGKQAKYAVYAERSLSQIDKICGELFQGENAEA